jgi:epoxyqueuosine reductase
MPTKSQISLRIKELALEAGFHKVGIAAARPLEHADFLEEWLDSGKHGAMVWMESYLYKRMDVGELYPDAKSVISVAHNYYTAHKHSEDTQTGKISRYAWGKDYHKIIKKKLKKLLNKICKLDDDLEGRIYVDTAPIQDKLWARQAGIGWQGKNTNILNREMGSWFFLGEIVLNRELAYDRPVVDRCGSCTACIDACPTKALVPYKIDATRCLSYLTIEYWDRPIPEKYASKMNNWIFGCDICQDVCPWNKFARETDEPGYQPEDDNLDPALTLLSNMSVDEFKKRFKKSPVYRSRYKNFIRNVKTVLANLSS